MRCATLVLHRQGRVSMIPAQRNYYQLPSAATVLNDRISALRETIPLGSVIIDIGCNDGTISDALVGSGHARAAHCYDLENIMAVQRPEISFQEMDLYSADLSSLPPANGVLLLNVLHHIIGRSVERAREIINYLLNRYEFLIIDLGSCSEKGDWGWRRTYDQHWPSDAELWNDLFAEAEWRFKLLRYPTQGNGHRVLWKLCRRGYQLSKLTPVSSYRRNAAAWPADKRICEITGPVAASADFVDTVVFGKAQSPQKDWFWTKRYLDRSGPLRAEMEWKLSAHAAEALTYLNKRIGKEYKKMRVCKPVGLDSDGTLYFPLAPDLQPTDVVHFQDWAKFFTENEVHRLSGLAAKQTSFLNFDHVQLGNLCDFQAAHAWDGITLLDFEPNLWLVQVAELQNRIVELGRFPSASPGPYMVNEAAIHAALREKLPNARGR